MSLFSGIGELLAPSPSPSPLSSSAIESEGGTGESVEAKLSALSRIPPLHEDGFPSSRIVSLKLDLPPAPQPLGNYIPLTLAEGLLYTAGIPPLDKEGLHRGKVQTTEQRAIAARQVGLTMISLLLNKLGSLDVIERLVKVTGYVNCMPEFTDHASVLDGFSSLMVEIFGESGRGVRSAIGASSLPNNISVEVEAVWLLKDDIGA